jgi:hypothetical protein
MESICQICQRKYEPLRRNRCHSCNEYFRRHGIERTRENLALTNPALSKVCINGHPKNQENSYIGKDGERNCRACHRLREIKARRKRGINPRNNTGLSHTVEYRTFLSAKARCRNPREKSWKNYGGRGIEFRFTSFQQFFSELGQRPKGLTLDRIHNDGHYEPGNVRWATYSEQLRNRRPARLSRPDCCRHGHQFTESNTYLWNKGRYRKCKKCSLNNTKRWQKKRWLKPESEVSK